MRIKEKTVTALIGPSGCGKSTLLRMFNRMNDLMPDVITSGNIHFYQENDSEDISKMDVLELRSRVGMVFQKPNPFPMSVFENVAYGPKVQGIKNKKTLKDIVKKSLQQAALWDEVKDNLEKPAHSLSGGQQQRLCLARALAVKPKVLLMDEPTSALDPISTLKVEDLIGELKEHYTILIVTHNMQQAARVSDYTAFMLNGELVEFDETSQIFNKPKERLTEEYITGRFG